MTPEESQEYLRQKLANPNLMEEIKQWGEEGTRLASQVTEDYLSRVSDDYTKDVSDEDHEKANELANKAYNEYVAKNPIWYEIWALEF